MHRWRREEGYHWITLWPRPHPHVLVKDYLDTPLPIITRLCNTSIACRNLRRGPSLLRSSRRLVQTWAMSRTTAPSRGSRSYPRLSRKSWRRNWSPTWTPTAGSPGSSLMSDATTQQRRRSFACFRIFTPPSITAGSCSSLYATIYTWWITTSYWSGSLCLSVYTGRALEWIRSFLLSRSQSVRPGNTSSPSSSIRYRLSQGSILGPLLYIIYTADVDRVVRSFGFAVQLYADDTQLYSNSLPMDAEDLSVRVFEAISAVESWMSSNRLRLNADKT